MIEIISKVQAACFGLNTEKREKIHGDVLDRLRRLFVKGGLPGAFGLSTFFFFV